MAANARQAKAMASVANQKGYVLSDALAYRHHPLTVRIRKIITSGELGAIRHIEA